MDRNLALELVRVTEAAALSSARFMGKGDPLAADRAAASAMKLAMQGVKITGHIIIGDEGQEDSPLCSGCVVGAGGEPEVDLALDPLESKASLACGQSNAISAIALGPRGAFREFRARYMMKIAVGSDAADRIDLNSSVFDNLVKIAEAKRVYVEDLTVSILDRKRHKNLIEEVRKAGARIELLRDGDLAASIASALPGTGIDVLIGVGNTRQGVISAAALSCLGGGFQARLVKDERDEGEDEAEDYETIFNIEALTGRENIMFAATGVSHSDFLEGVIFRHGGAVTHSIGLRGKSGTVRILKTQHFFDKDPDYT
ncbi:MAG: class II fructose-bisphosphatase [Candidatus Krumholzibacteriota bacterium]|nr:class II fructose-bisphosphatase [Candidatus Krumholzibacteriota bacterium]